MSEVARLERGRRARGALPGSRHDRVIALLQVVLPMAIGVLAAFLVMAPLFMRGDVSFVLDKNKVDVASERMRLRAATYRGADGEGRPFRIDAGSAVQQSSAEPVVRMQDLAARIRLADGPARLTANHGRYLLEEEQVALDGPIAFRAADGYRLDAEDATLDLKTRQLNSARPVAGETPLGTFRGDSMRADLESRVVRLEGNARLRIRPSQPR